MVVRSASVTPTPSAVTVEYGLATESNAGMDGAIQWQSVFLLNDGRIISFGTGNHTGAQSNAVRCIDPVSTPGIVDSYDLFPMDIGSYVSNYDNHPSIYIPSDDVAIWAGHGVFDVGLATWTYGELAPATQTWDEFVDISNFPAMGTVYNPSVAWCSDLDKGIWFGASGGGDGDPNTLVILERQVSGAPWKLTPADLGSQGVPDLLGYSRNSAVCVGTTLYLIVHTHTGGLEPTINGTIFYKIDVATATVLATLTAPTRDASDYYWQLIHDSDRGKLVLIGIRIQEYSIVDDEWTDRTPVGWPGYTSPMGVYHPGQGCIYFRGIKVGGSGLDHFEWHRLAIT